MHIVPQAVSCISMMLGMRFISTWTPGGVAYFAVVHHRVNEGYERDGGQV